MSWPGNIYYPIIDSRKNILQSNNWFLNNSTTGKRCYSYEKGNRFFFMKGIEYELLGAESVEGDKTWTGVIHRFKKRYPGPDDDKDDRWEVSMVTLTNKILADQQKLQPHCVTFNSKKKDET